MAKAEAKIWHQWRQWRAGVTTAGGMQRQRSNVAMLTSLGGFISAAALKSIMKNGVKKAAGIGVKTSAAA